MSTMNVLDALTRELDAGRPIALCAIVATKGSTPQPPGTIVAVDRAAVMHGTLGGGCVEADVRRQAHQRLTEALKHASPIDASQSTIDHRQSTIPQPAAYGDLLAFQLDDDFGYDSGMICGGRMDIAVQVLCPGRDAEPVHRAVDRLRAGHSSLLPVRALVNDQPAEYRIDLEPDPRLLIAGAGHIGRILAEMTVPLGFAVTVIDDRRDYANSQRFPPPIKPIVGDIAKTLARQCLDGATYVVIVTRGHKQDEHALAAVLDSPAAYIGMIGSRRKIAVTFDDLKQAGARQDRTYRRLLRCAVPVPGQQQAVVRREGHERRLRRRPPR
ncbi:MAG: XdhC family protein [Phycisphaerae bacterium]